MQQEFDNKLKKIIEYCDDLEILHSEDPKRIFLIEKMENLLSIEENDTIAILNKLNKNQIKWINPIFEEISGNLQSEKFINCIEEIGKKYPDIRCIQDDIQDAKDAMDEE